MAQITRKVTFDADGAPSPRVIAAGMEQDNNARLIQFAAPHITDGQQVYINLSVGDVSDTVRLYEDGDGLYGWSVGASTLVKFGNGKAQLKIIDAADPLNVKWQSGTMGLSIGAALDVDVNLSYKYPTAIEQIQAELQRVELATTASAQAALNSENAAAGSAQAALNSENAAAASAQAALDSKNTAAGSAQAALTSENAAAASAQAALDSKNAAAGSAQSAANSAAQAAQIVTGNLDDRYIKRDEYSDADVLIKLMRVDGSGSGLDADTLDGKDMSYFAAADSAATKAELASGLNAKADAEDISSALSLKADKSHTHTAADVTAGTLAGRVQANASAVATLANKQLRNIVIATSAPSGASNGDIWLSYTQ